MAVETGTATGGQDFYDKLISFLTTNTDLVAAGQEWSVVWQAPTGAENETDVVVRGPGLSGTNAVYVCMRYTANVSGDAYYISARGATGYLADSEEFDEHVNVTPSSVRMFLDSGTMSYTFVANGRRFVAIAKISTTFEAMYAGLFLPYATPLSYPYPLFIGGSAGPTDSDGPTNWRTINDNHSHFVEPHYNSGASFVDAGAWMLDPAGAWQRVACRGSTAPIGIHPVTNGGDYFLSADDSLYGYQPRFVLRNTMDAYGGDRILWPCTLIQYGSVTQTYGILEGAFRCQGYMNAAENLITYDSVDHMVIPNVYRSDLRDYWALAME